MQRTRSSSDRPGSTPGFPRTGAGTGAGLKAVLGPTNTGKTHYAIERMLCYKTGMIGLPLRLLAREVYNRVCERVGTQAVALVTGEERIIPPKARFWIATVEAMPRGLDAQFVAIDEIQIATDLERGHVFTRHILNTRGSMETLLLGADTMAPVIKALLPGIEILQRPRLSQLFYAGSRKISRVPPRTAIIAFSAAQVYAIAELVRRERGGAAVVMGALSPRTRNAQVELYQNGDVDIIVATDAIGMGLNLNIDHVAFSSDTKFDGHQTRPLTPAEMAQIAGRAGRHTNDGTFGVTGNANPLEEEMIERLQTHDFEPVKILQWRNGTLDFSSPRNLLTSLQASPAHTRLARTPLGTDQKTLEQMLAQGTAARARTPDLVALLWESCQIPDYRDISPAQHVQIVTRVFDDLASAGRVSQDWFRQQLRFCDNMSGDIDTLSNRIRQIRTWTFIAHKKDWLDEHKYWQHHTRDIENRLSDALHERLTRRFVDKRTSILIRHLRDKRMTTPPQINPKGEILIEGHLIGSIEGFRFKLARNDLEADTKNVKNAAAAALAPEISNRARRLVAAPNDQIVLSADGFLRWRGEVIAELAEGDELFAPRILVLADESLNGTDLEQVQDRLALWLKHTINTQLEQILALRDPEGLEGAARGVAFQLAENFGILSRQKVAGEVRGLDQEVRGKMRRMGIRFGAYHIYLPMTLKPAPRELALVLFALKNGGLRQPGVADIPAIVLSGRTSFEIDPQVNPALYEVAGFKIAGKRAVRVDILERLADIIRPLISFDPERSQGEKPEGAARRNGFQVTVQMTSLLGCAGEDFSAILKSLGYRLERTPLPAAEQEKRNGDPQTEPETPADTAGKETHKETQEQNQQDREQRNQDQENLAALDGTPPETKADAKSADCDLEDLEKLDAKPDSTDTGNEKSPALPEAGAEPRFEEVWFPPSRNPSGFRRPKKPGNAASGKNSRHPAGSSSRQAPAPEHKKSRSATRTRDRNRPVDPDSPFAALAALKLGGDKK